MVQRKERSLALRLQDIGVKKSYAYMLAWGKRSPPLPLALRIHDELGVKLGPIADATPAQIKALAGLGRDAAA